MRLSRPHFQTLLYAGLILLIAVLGVATVFSVNALRGSEFFMKSQLQKGKTYAPTLGQFTEWQDPPASANHKTPQDSVLSYLQWTSWAYYMGKSDLAMNAKAMSAFEEPRVSAYISKLIQDDSRINQRLDRLEIVSVKTKAYSSTTSGYTSYTQTATVKAKESWTYNYQTLSTGKWGPPDTATYETTYILYKDSKTGWLVDSVTVDSSTGVK